MLAAIAQTADPAILRLRQSLILLIALILTAGAGLACDTRETADAPREERGAAAEPDADTARFTQDQSAVEGVQRAQTGEDAVTITKTVPERIRLGTPLTYQINVTARQELNALIVREELPEGFEFEQSTPQAQLGEDGRTLTFRMDHLSDGQEQQISIRGTPQQVGALQTCTTYEIDRGVCATFEVVNPELRLTKQGPERASVCEPVTYTYVIRNEGQTAAENVLIYDRLPEGLTMLDGDGGDAGREVRIEVGSLEPGQEASRQVQVVAEQPLQQAGSYAYAESSLDEVRSQRVVTQFVAPALQIEAVPDRPFEYVGRQASFTVTVRNVGEAVAPNTRVRLNLDGGQLAAVHGQPSGEAQLAAGQEQGQLDAGEIADDGLNLGTLQPGETRRFMAEVAAEDAGRVQLTATATSACPRTDRAIAQADDAAAMQIRELSALQVTVIDRVDPLRVGEETIYELSVLNEGSATERNLRVAAELPEGASFVGAEGPTQVQGDGRNLAFQPVSELPAGESVTWYIRVRADEATGSARFVAQVQTDTMDEPVRTAEPTRLY